MQVRRRGSFACDLLPDSRQCCPGRHDEPQQPRQLQPAAWEAEFRQGNLLHARQSRMLTPCRRGLDSLSDPS